MKFKDGRLLFQKITAKSSYSEIYINLIKLIKKKQASNRVNSCLKNKEMDIFKKVEDRFI